MMTTKVTILAKSSKHKGFCVAGVDENGRWVRLVSDEQGEALAGSYCSNFDVLDVVSLLIEPKPIKYQPENILVKSKCSNVGKTNINDLLKKHPYLLHNGDYIFANNTHKVFEEDMGLLKNSLLIAKVKDISTVFLDGRKCKASFVYNGRNYINVSVTDPNCYTKDPISYKGAYIVVSVPSEPWETYGYFKFVAAIYPITN